MRRRLVSLVLLVQRRLVIMRGLRRFRAPRTVALRASDFLVATGDRGGLFRRWPNEAESKLTAPGFFARVSLACRFSRVLPGILQPLGSRWPGPAAGDRPVRRRARDARRFDRSMGLVMSCWPVNVARPPVGPDAGMPLRRLSSLRLEVQQLALFFTNCWC